MKKISIMSLHLGHGGAERAICTLANCLSDSYEVEILCMYRTEDCPAYYVNPEVRIRYLTGFVPNNVLFRSLLREGRILRAAVEGFRGLRLLRLKNEAAVRAIRECDADLIISTREYFNRRAGRYIPSGTRFVAWEHNHPDSRGISAADVCRSCAGANALVTVSEEMRAIYEREFSRLGISCPVLCIPNGTLVPDTFSYAPEGSLIAVGRLEKIKGFDDLVDIISKLPSEQLVLAGDGSERADLERKVSEAGCADRVTFTGFVSPEELDVLYRASSMLIMTSHSESFGLVLLEAMSRGIPCVAFDSARGACGLIENGRNGYLISGRDKQKMVDIIKELRNDPSQLARLSDGARKTAEGYSVDNVSPLWTGLVDGVLSGQE